MIQQKLQTLCLKLAVPAMALAMAIPAHAVSVTFSTTGTFTCASCTGSGTSTVTYNGTGNNFLTLSFLGTTQTDLLTPDIGDTFIGMGTLGTVSAKSFLMQVPIGNPTTLAVSINQSASAGITAGTGVLNATLTGKVGGAGTTGEISFMPASVVIGNVEYTLEQTNDEFTITPPSTSHSAGLTSLPLKLVATELPEPTFLSLTGIAFAGLSAFAIQRRRRNAN